MARTKRRPVSNERIDPSIVEVQTEGENQNAAGQSQQVTNAVQTAINSIPSTVSIHPAEPCSSTQTQEATASTPEINITISDPSPGDTSPASPTVPDLSLVQETIEDNVAADPGAAPGTTVESVADEVEVSDSVNGPQGEFSSTEVTTTSQTTTFPTLSILRTTTADGDTMTSAIPSLDNVGDTVMSFSDNPVVKERGDTALLVTAQVSVTTDKIIESTTTAERTTHSDTQSDYLSLMTTSSTTEDVNLNISAAVASQRYVKEGGFAASVFNDNAVETWSFEVEYDSRDNNFFVGARVGWDF